MAFTAKYSDLGTLALNSTFVLRIAGAVANYAKYTLGNNAATLSQRDWAKTAIYNPQNVANQIAFLCALDPSFSGESTSPIDPSAANISDTALDSVVQTAISNSILMF